MAKEPTIKGKKVAALSTEVKIAEALAPGGNPAIWVRDDGAICVGDECIVIKPDADGKDLNIEVAPTRCGAALGELLVDHLVKTIGKGGSTNFKVKSSLGDESK